MIYLISIITGLIVGWFLTRLDDIEDDVIDLSNYMLAVIGALFGQFFFYLVLGIRLTQNFQFVEAILWSLIGILVMRLVIQLFIFTDEELDKLESQAVTAHDYKSIQRKKPKIKK